MNLRQHLKFISRGYLSKAKPNPMLVGILALGIYAVLSILDSEITNAVYNNQIINEAYQQYLNNNNFDHLMSTISSMKMSGMQSLLSVLLSLMMLMIWAATSGVWPSR